MLGQGTFSLKLGQVAVEVEVVVADIDDDGLLGIDVLQNGKGGPADLLLSKGVLQVKDEEVPIIQVGSKSKVRRVTAAHHTIVPAKAEAVINVYVGRSDFFFKKAPVSVPNIFFLLKMFLKCNFIISQVIV